MMVKIEGFVKADNQDDGLDQEGTGERAKQLLAAVPGVVTVVPWYFDDDWANGDVVLEVIITGEDADAMIAAIRKAGWREGIGDIDWMDHEIVEEAE